MWKRKFHENSLTKVISWLYLNIWSLQEKEGKICELF